MGSSDKNKILTSHKTGKGYSEGINRELGRSELNPTESHLANYLIHSYIHYKTSSSGDPLRYFSLFTSFYILQLHRYVYMKSSHHCRKYFPISCHSFSARIVLNKIKMAWFTYSTEHCTSVLQILDDFCVFQFLSWLLKSVCFLAPFYFLFLSPLFSFLISVMTFIPLLSEYFPFLLIFPSFFLSF